MGHPLNGGGHVLHVGVDDPVWVHVCQLHGHSDLVLQALGPGLADRELAGQGVIGGRRVVDEGSLEYSRCSLSRR